MWEWMTSFPLIPWHSATRTSGASTSCELTLSLALTLKVEQSLIFANMFLPICKPRLIAWLMLQDIEWFLRARTIEWRGCSQGYLGRTQQLGISWCLQQLLEGDICSDDVGSLYQAPAHGKQHACGSPVDQQVHAQSRDCEYERKQTSDSSGACRLPQPFQPSCSVRLPFWRYALSSQNPLEQLEALWGRASNWFLFSGTSPTATLWPSLLVHFQHLDVWKSCEKLENLALQWHRAAVTVWHLWLSDWLFIQ